MRQTVKIELLKRLIARGEVECAWVCAFDWNLEKRLVGILSGKGVKNETVQ